MGSIISLGLGALEIDWGKNSFFRNHSQLFLPNDVKDVTYFYAEDLTAIHPAYVRTLRSVKKRIELLGYTISNCRYYYEKALNEFSNHCHDLNISFDLLARILGNVDVQKIRTPDEPEYYDFGEYVVENILNDPEFIKSDKNIASLTKEDGQFFENFDPYIILRLLAENSKNLDLEVIWRFNDVVEGGWIKEIDLYEGVSESDKILVVTEGSSDSNIISMALKLIHPDISDFFKFIDMTDNYPFTGAGNLLRFCQGLCQIGILNRVLVVLDNDAVGRATYEKINSLKLPDRMQATILPELDIAKAVKTLGPTGCLIENINGRAVSIEFFLDLKIPKKDEAIVRWTVYDKSTDSYQGELIGKDDYVRSFFARIDTDPGYDKSKLAILLNHLLSIAIAI